MNDFASPMRDTRCGQACLVAALLLAALCANAAAPVVSNIRASQQSGPKLVDIYYDLTDPDSASLTVTVSVSTDGGATYTLPATSFTGAVGAGVPPGANKKITWDAGADWNGRYSANVRFRVCADDAAAPPGMALIPAGSFTMGNYIAAGEGSTDELPLHSVYVSGFYMDRYEVTKALWDEVKAWNGGNGYSYDYVGSGKAANHPVHSICWYDAVKWCNARSQKAGLTPCYYTDSGLTVVYKMGKVALYVNWNANGYRLPTEAEWEKAARGGVAGHRFPWSDSNTITHSRANYYSSSSYSYDTSPTRNFHPMFATGGFPYSSPVVYFAPNGYGLYDMAGNMFEWCSDWYSSSYYSSSPGTDPRGPSSSGSYRVLRGGSWDLYAFYARCAYRYGYYPDYAGSSFGFRCVRGL